MVVLVATMPAREWVVVRSSTSSTASVVRSGAILMSNGFLEFTARRVFRISSRADLFCNLRKLGVLGELTLTTKKSANFCKARKVNA